MHPSTPWPATKRTSTGPSNLLEAAVVFVAGIATAAVAAFSFLRNGGIAILFLGGLPTVLFFAIGFHVVSSAALRNRRSASRLQVEGDEEDGTLRGIIVAGHGRP